MAHAAHLFALALTLILISPLAAEARQIPDMSGAEFPMMMPPGRPAKTGTGRLRGRITAADSGAIVRRAQVRISGPDIGSKTAFTDAQGRYEFRDLPAGRFNLSVSKSGFVTMQFGQSRPHQSGKQIELADAQVMDKADVSLPRGSAVSGRILDEFGEPVSDASVTAMRLQYAAGKRRLVPSGRASTTNDLGYFRVFGLPPGDYYLTANLRTMETMMMDLIGGAAGGGGPTGSNSNSGYAATYYPGTPNPAEAQRLSLVVGQELQIDLQMQPVRLARITGTASSSDGKPMGNAMVLLIPSMKDAIGLMPGGTSRTDKDGHFVLNNIAPGDYSIQVQSLVALMSAASQVMTMMSGAESKEPAPAAKPMEREFAVANLSVAGEDISGVMITGTRGARATGRLVFEGGEKPEPLTSIRMIAVPTDLDNMGANASAFGMASVKENGTFEVDGLVGGRTFQLMNPPKGWFVKRITHEGDDVTDKGRDFKPGEEVEGFEITMTRHSQRVTGRVTTDSGDPVKEYTVIAFAEDPAKWTLPSNRWIKSARPDQDGKFQIADLPAGKYLAIAVEYVAQGEWNDPEWLARAAKEAKKFTVDDGGTATVDLKLLKS